MDVYSIIGIIIAIFISNKIQLKKLKQIQHTKCINNEKVITNKQLDDIVKLFDRDYRPKTIVVYNKRNEIFTHFLKTDIIVTVAHLFSFGFWKGNAEGAFNPLLDTIVLFTYTERYDNNDLETIQLFSIHTLVHELRHRKQMVNMQNREKDADNFANNIINDKSEKISKIMNWSEEWKVEE